MRIPIGISLLPFSPFLNAFILWVERLLVWWILQWWLLVIDVLDRWQRQRSRERLKRWSRLIFSAHFNVFAWIIVAFQATTTNWISAASATTERTQPPPDPTRSIAWHWFEWRSDIESNHYPRRRAHSSGYYDTKWLANYAIRAHSHHHKQS